MKVFSKVRHFMELPKNYQKIFAKRLFKHSLKIIFIFSIMLLAASIF